MVNLVSQMQRRWANIVIEIGQEYKKKNNVDNLFKKKILRIKNKKIHVNTKYLVTLDGIINQIICNY